MTQCGAGTAASFCACSSCAHRPSSNLITKNRLMNRVATYRTRARAPGPLDSCFLNWKTVTFNCSMIAMRESLRRDLSLSANSVSQVSFIHGFSVHLFEFHRVCPLSAAATASPKSVSFSRATTIAQLKSPRSYVVFAMLLLQPSTCVELILLLLQLSTCVELIVVVTTVNLC
jgi:hypothetical protein